MIRDCAAKKPGWRQVKNCFAWNSHGKHKNVKQFGREFTSQQPDLRDLRGANEPSKGERMSKRRVPLYLRILIICAFLTVNNAAPQVTSDFQKIAGYWEGEFMPGNNLTLILAFHEQNDGTMAGRILLFQGKIQIQDDPLKNIFLEKNRLSFLIAAKDTPFNGKLDSNGLQITGNLKFPNGSTHPVAVKKVEKPSLGEFAKAKQSRRGDNILEKKYSVKQLQSDFAFLRRQLENTHPKLYGFISKERFDGQFDSTFQAIKAEMTEDAFLRLLAPLTTKVRCSHTRIQPSREFSNALRNKRSLLPLDIKIFGEKAYIVANYSQSSAVSAGMRVLSINGRESSEIWKRLAASVPSDGFNRTYKAYEINANFSHVYSLYIGNDERFDLECLTPSGSKVRVQLQGQTRELLDEAIENAHPERFSAKTLPLQLQIFDEGGTALLSVKSFGSPNHEEYKAFLRKSFSRMKAERIRRLVIDVRGNLGGHPFLAAELLSYLTKSGFTYFETPKEQGEFSPLYRPIKRKNQYFEGEVYVLINGSCLSSTGHFLSLIKYHKLAVLIGEESGGTFYCNDKSIRITLPETGIMLNLPQDTFQTAVTGFKMGDPLMPDYIVKPKLGDILDGRDAELEFVFQLIKKGRK